MQPSAISVTTNTNETYLPKNCGLCSSVFLLFSVVCSGRAYPGKFWWKRIFQPHKETTGAPKLL